MIRVFSIDPGDVHCGTVSFKMQDGLATAESGREMTPDELISFLEVINVDFIVCESFMLDPGRMLEQSWSEMLTSQLIGVIKYICRKRDIPLQMQQPGWRKIGRERMNGVGYRWWGPDDHIRSAEEHGWYFILKNLKGKWANT